MSLYEKCLKKNKIIRFKTIVIYENIAGRYLRGQIFSFFLMLTGSKDGEEIGGRLFLDRAKGKEDNDMVTIIRFRFLFMVTSGTKVMY